MRSGCLVFLAFYLILFQFNFIRFISYHDDHFRPPLNLHIILLQHDRSHILSVLLVPRSQLYIEHGGFDLKCLQNLIEREHALPQLRHTYRPAEPLVFALHFSSDPVHINSLEFVQAPIVQQLVLTFLNLGAVLLISGQVREADLEKAVSLLVAVGQLSSIKHDNCIWQVVEN